MLNFRYKAQSDTDAKIKSNVEIVIAKQLQDVTQALRKGQREYVTKIQQLHGNDSIRDDDEYDEDVSTKFYIFYPY